MGQANHFLITILVGLDAVKDGAQKCPGFQTVWAPKSVAASVSRSRHYVIKSALAWAVDNLDMYLRLCNRMPRLYGEEESLDIADTKHSVFLKLMVVLRRHAELPIGQAAYVDLLICWRNRLVHFDAENQLSTPTQRYFRNIPASDSVISKYHLDVDEMLKHFTKMECPTFKEITTLISMTIHFVETLDHILLDQVDQYQFLTQTLSWLLKQDETALGVFSHRNTTPLKRQKRLKQLFVTNGIPEDFYNADGQKFIEDISSLTAEGFLAKIAAD